MPTRRKPHHTTLQSWWGWGVLLLAIAGTAFWYGAGGWGGWNAEGPLWRGTETAPWRDDSRGASTGARSGEAISTVAGNPEGYYGRAITIVGRVTGVLTPRVFVIAQPSSNSELVVVAKDVPPTVGGRPAGAALQINDGVEVYGLVERFDADRFEREYHLGLDPAVANARRNQPALIADRIRVSPGGALPTR